MDSLKHQISTQRKIDPLVKQALLTIIDNMPTGGSASAGPAGPAGAEGPAGPAGPEGPAAESA